MPEAASVEEAAIEAGAVAWFESVQEGRRDPGAYDENGERWTWTALTESDRRGYRELARRIVLPALAATVSEEDHG